MHQRLHSTILLIFALSLLWISSAVAQERRGIITGNVADKEHAVLPGAQVVLDPGGRKGVTDNLGQFTFQEVAPGHYTVTISYVGFQPFSKEVDVTSGAVAGVDAVMQISEQKQVVEVVAGREKGEVEALNLERTADNILQVLPADVITSLPNTNIADAVGRMPSVSLERDEGEGKYVQIRGAEPRLNNVTVDGVHLPSPENVRNVKLDAIPADLVEEVQLSKTLSANQEGDAIGGSVNLVTKSAGNDPYVSALGMGGWTPAASGRGLNQFSLTTGDRFLSNKRLGVLVGGEYDWNGRGIDDVEPGEGQTPIVDPKTGAAIGAFLGPNGYDQREYWYDRTRFGFGGTLDYKLGDWSTAYIRGLFSQFKDDGQDWIYSPAVGTFSPNPTLTNPDGSSSFSHVTRKPAQRLFSTSAGAHQTFGNTLLSYEVAFGQARFTGFFPTTNFGAIPGGTLLNLAGNGLVQYGFNGSDPFTPVLTALNANIFDPTQYAISRLRRGDDHTFERDVTGSVDLARNYNLGSHFSTFQIGFKIRDAHKSELDTQETFNATPAFGPGQMSNFLGSFKTSNYYFGVYPQGVPTTNYAKIISFFNSNTSFFTPDPLGDAAQDFGADFSLDERVTAGYVMNTLSFGKDNRFRLQAGVRIESTTDSYLANSVQAPGGELASVTPNPGSQDYINVLPSIQFQTRFGQDTVMRLAYGIGIARPNFGDIVPSVSFDPTVHFPQPAVSAGNPALQPTHAQNFDVLFEHYLKPFGAIEGGFFYKYLTNPIFNSLSTLNSGPFAGNNQNQPINGPNAYLLGFEFTWQQRLSMLPGFLNGSGVRANYSWTTSQATFPSGANAVLGGRTDQPALQRQAPNNWNFDYTFDKWGMSARMGLTHNDASIFFYNFVQGSPGGIKGPLGDQYLYPHTQADLQVSYWLPHTHGFQVIGYVLNMTDETFGFYQGSERFPIQREYYGPTVAGGLRWTLGREH